MIAVEGVAQAGVDDALTDFQGHLSVIFSRARTLWKESAARVHPDLQPAGYKLLTFMARVSSSNAHELSELFEMDKSVISRQVRMLEEFGLLESRPDERDGRLRVLTATAAARSALVAVRSDHANRLRAALAGLDPEELRIASKVLGQLAGA